jgi:sarcosine oxidase subunit gamma
MANRSSALAEAYKEGSYGTASPENAGVVLRERRGLCLVQVAAFPEDREAAARTIDVALGVAPPLETNRMVADDRITILWSGPDRWLLVEGGGRNGLDRVISEAFAETPSVAVTNLSHARTVLRISGPNARDLLAKGTAIDLHPDSFGPGDCAMTRFGQIAVTIAASDEETLEIYSLRTFARSLLDDLIDQAGEFGCRVEPPLEG